MLELGNDVAAGLGLPVSRVELAAILIGVLLAAFATAAAGPIVFVALVAPHIARRLTRSASTGLLSSAAVGALLRIASDLVARRLRAPDGLPVGIVTGALGARPLTSPVAGIRRGGTC